VPRSPTPNRMPTATDIDFEISADVSGCERELDVIRRYVESQRAKRQAMNPIIYLPRGTKRLPLNLIGWVNRFSVPSASGRWYVLAQNKTKRHWACSCPGYTRRNLGIPGGERAVELILQVVDGSFTIYSDGVEQRLPSIPDDKTRKLIDRIAQRSAKLAGKIIQPAATASATEPQQAKPSARRIVLNEDV